MASLVRAVLCNPLSASAGRLQDLVRAFATEDVLALVGTQRHCVDEGLTVQREGRWSFWRWGYCTRTVGTNKSCGITIGLGPRLQRFVRQVYDGPSSLAGRVGGLRVRIATKDLLLLLLALYMPPRHTVRESVYNATVDGIVRWVDETISSAPRRTVPQIMADVNDEFGLDLAFGRIDSVASVGFNLGVQHRPAHALVRLFEVLHLRVASTFVDSPPSIYGQRRHTSRMTMCAFRRRFCLLWFGPVLTKRLVVMCSWLRFPTSSTTCPSALTFMRTSPRFFRQVAGTATAWTR